MHLPCFSPVERMSQVQVMPEVVSAARKAMCPSGITIPNDNRSKDKKSQDNFVWGEDEVRLLLSCILDYTSS